MKSMRQMQARALHVPPREHKQPLCRAQKSAKHKHHLVPRCGLLRIAHVCIGLSKPTQRLSGCNACMPKAFMHAARIPHTHTL